MLVAYGCLLPPRSAFQCSTAAGVARGTSKKHHTPWPVAPVVILGLGLVISGMWSRWVHNEPVELGSGRMAAPWLVPQVALRDYDHLRESVAEEHGWQEERAEGAVVEYLRFLALLAESPKMELIASSDVDLVWHAHLLDTENYAIDSLRLFGRFLHHRRARTSQEFSAIPASYARTKTHYEERFGIAPPLRFWGPTTEAASMCGGNKAVDPNPYTSTRTTATTSGTTSTATAVTMTSTTSSTSTTSLRVALAEAAAARDSGVQVALAGATVLAAGVPIALALLVCWRRGWFRTLETTTAPKPIQAWLPPPPSPAPGGERERPAKSPPKVFFCPPPPVEALICTCSLKPQGWQQQPPGKGQAATERPNSAEPNFLWMSWNRLAARMAPPPPPCPLHIPNDG
mmetsp:Transcript_23760/g.51887  ORF Transcript_23760/g.51887 Transcript_23760/m.51887 type:complete len:401 (+) Transcript_23760:70-1272(+)